MPKHIIIPLLVFITTITACNRVAPINPSPTAASGIEGMVTEGPMCPGPVPVGDNPCPDQPYQATISVLSAENTQVAQIQSDAQGHFKIELIPGTYTLHPISAKPFPHAGDLSVVVDPGQYTQVAILFDTGMR